MLQCLELGWGLSISIIQLLLIHVFTLIGSERARRPGSGVSFHHASSTKPKLTSQCTFFVVNFTSTSCSQERGATSGRCTWWRARRGWGSRSRGDAAPGAPLTVSSSPTWRMGGRSRGTTHRPHTPWPSPWRLNPYLAKVEKETPVCMRFLQHANAAHLFEIIPVQYAIWIATHVCQTLSLCVPMFVSVLWIKTVILCLS